MNMSATSTSADMALKRAQVEPYVEQTAAQYGLPEELIHAVIRAESSYNANSVSSAGAQGLMQLMPATARALGVTNSFDPAQNIDGGANYLRQMLDRFDGDVRLALAAYNCGPARVESLGITSSMDSSSYAKLSSGVRTYVSRVLGFAGVTTA
jgi:soluble lytic murein transglycosylase-like protein